MKRVELEVVDGIAVATIDNPPVNALSWEVRGQLVEAIETADSDPDVQSIVICANGRTFPAGADIREFGKPPVEPLLPEVCNRVESLKKPVVAALHGTVLGGGLELALAADFRIAKKDTSVGFPEVKLGILPGAGGTQRAPRICGVGPSLDMMISGRPINTDKARKIGLLDSVVESGLKEEALTFAAKLTASDKKYSSDDPPDMRIAARNMAEISRTHDKIMKLDERLIAPRRIVECVQASQTMPLVESLALERRCFLECVASEQSASLRHMFFAERTAARPPAGVGETVRSIRRVGIVGGGTMGSGIAVAFLNAEFTVTIVEANPEASLQATHRIFDIFEDAMMRGLINRRTYDKFLGEFEATDNLSGIADADLVIEAVNEDLGIKESVLSKLGELLRPDAIIATNTSYLDVNALCRATGSQANTLGMHFFAPAHKMKLVEIIPGEKTAADVVTTAFSLVKKLGKNAVWSGACEGFIGNRILSAYREAADLMLLDGATPYQIDRAVQEFGFPLGVYATLDLSGLDVSWDRRKRWKESLPEGRRYCPLSDMLCEAGRFGRKTAIGYYLYENLTKSLADPEVLEMLAEARRHSGSNRQLKVFSTPEIMNRILAAMINEATRILSEGYALRPSDIDVVKVLGFGFPRWRGGPMRYVDSIGANKILQWIQQYSEDDPLFWRPAPLLSRMSEDGVSFADINRDTSYMR